MPAARNYSRIIDVSATHPNNVVGGSEKLTEQLVWQVYSQFGQISAIFPWESKHGKPHFYIEYASETSVARARSTPSSEFACFIISKDKQHQLRFAEISSPMFHKSASTPAQKSARSGIRYSPYTIPGGLQTLSNSQYAADNCAEPSRRGEDPTSLGSFSALFHSPPPLYNGHNNTMSSRNFDEDVFIREHAASRLVAEPDGHASNSFTHASPSPPNSHSLQTSPEQILKVLSDLREKKALEIGESNRSPIRHRIHPKFDFRRHITSGQFLLSNTSLSIDAPTTFELTPLQAYFADIYGSLQSELYETKQGYKQKMFLLEQQRILCDRLTDEAADERSLRRVMEKQVEDLQRSLQTAIATSDDHRLAEERYANELEDARREIDSLRRTIGHIQSIVAGPAQTSTM